MEGEVRTNSGKNAGMGRNSAPEGATWAQHSQVDKGITVIVPEVTPFQRLPTLEMPASQRVEGYAQVNIPGPKIGGRRPIW